MKLCRDCNNEMDKTGYVCSKCLDEKQRERRKKHYHKNPDRYKKEAKQWREENLDLYKENKKKHYIENRQTIRKKRKEYYEKNKEKIQADFKKRYWTDPEYRNKYKERRKIHVMSDQSRQRKNNWTREYEKREDIRILKLIRQKTRNLIKKGKMEKLEYCQLCGCKENIEVHHRNYKDPKDVMFVCKKCHAHYHAMHRVFKVD